MPKIVQQPHDDGGVMAIYSEQETRRRVRAGQNKWQCEIRDRIDVTWIGSKRFYSAEAINKYLRQQTERARPKPGARRRRQNEADRTAGGP